MEIQHLRTRVKFSLFLLKEKDKEEDKKGV